MLGAAGVANPSLAVCEAIDEWSRLPAIALSLELLDRPKTSAFCDDSKF